MAYWKNIILFQIIIITILTLFTGYFYFTIGNTFGILLGTLCLGLAIYIQLQVGLSITDRDIGISTELKNYGVKLEIIKNDISKIPKLIEMNNSNVTDFIKSNNSDICQCIDEKVLEGIQSTKNQNKK